jgi:putative MFS transporter
MLPNAEGRKSAGRNPRGTRATELVQVLPGEIAARLDRLPLRTVHWQYAIITQVAWIIIIADDGILARLYPLVYFKFFSHFVYSVLNAIQVGVGILAGEYIGSYLSDKFGRKKIMVFAAIDNGALIWLVGFTHVPVLLAVILFFQALGMGAILATNAVYMHEIVPPTRRGRLSQGATGFGRVAAFAFIWPPYFWVPSHYQWWLLSFTVASLVILVPLLLSVPESPRWLEAKGRTAEALKILEMFERRATKRSKQPLPPPDLSTHKVTPTGKVPVREIFTGEYRKRSILLLICWITGYSGIVYGFGSISTIILVTYEWSPHFIFLGVGLTTLVGGGAGFFLNSYLNERIERRGSIGAATIVYTAGLVMFYLFSGFVYRNELGLLAGMTLGYFGVGVYLFQMYNYTTASYPTRLRSIGTGWTDGVGHLGSIFGPIIVVALYDATVSHGGYAGYLYPIVLGALLPGFLIWRYGIRQRRAVLEVISP